MGNAFLINLLNSRDIYVTDTQIRQLGWVYVWTDTSASDSTHCLEFKQPASPFLTKEAASYCGHIKKYVGSDSCCYVVMCAATKQAHSRHNVLKDNLCCKNRYANVI